MTACAASAFLGPPAQQLLVLVWPLLHEPAAAAVTVTGPSSCSCLCGRCCMNQRQQQKGTSGLSGLMIAIELCWGAELAA